MLAGILQSTIASFYEDPSHYTIRDINYKDYYSCSVSNSIKGIFSPLSNICFKILRQVLNWLISLVNMFRWMYVNTKGFYHSMRTESIKVHE